MRIYPNSEVVIYYVERTPLFHPTVHARLAAPGTVIVSSDLIRLECLVKPVRSGDTALATAFRTFFATAVSELVAFTPAVFDRAIDIRARFNSYKTPDALHLALAIESKCDVFLTADQQLRQFTGITVEVI